MIEAAVLQAKSDRSLLLIEATCNQVNQEGGYTGMTPNDFRDYVQAIAAEFSFSTDRLILGGDHLGPNPWRSEPASQAIAAAKTMVEGYVRAGFTKVHLDASMPCADDPQALSNATLFANAGWFRKIKCKHGNAMCKWQRKLVRGTSWRARAWGQHVSFQKHPLKTWIRLLSADGECRLRD